MASATLLIGGAVRMRRSREAWEIAAESFGLATGPRVRPNPMLWLWYAYWGRLRKRHAMWVLYDLTCASWVVRHVARLLAAVAAPVTLIAIFLPAGGQLRALTAFIAGACALLFTVAWINESTEHRLTQAGYDWRLAVQLRVKRDDTAGLLRRW
jgi:hypothetical protein